MKKYIRYSFVFLLLLSGCGKQSQPPKAGVRTVKVRTAALQKHEFREIFRAQGMFLTLYFIPALFYVTHKNQ